MYVFIHINTNTFIYTYIYIMILQPTIAQLVEKRTVVGKFPRYILRSWVQYFFFFFDRLMWVHYLSKENIML